MPTIPKQIKHFFCRVTAPYDGDIIRGLPLYIKTKHYKHDFNNFIFVHEMGCKTCKPHYHFSITCATTKPQIMEWIRVNFNKQGNEGFQTTDKYDIESADITLAYMFKGGTNVLYNVVAQHAPLDTNIIKEVHDNHNDKLIEIYNKKLKKNDKNRDEKFEYYYELIEKKLNKKKLEQLDHDKVFGKIYYLLIREAISARRFFRKNILAEHAFVLSCHFCNSGEVDKMITNQVFIEIKKVLDII